MFTSSGEITPENLSNVLHFLKGHLPRSAMVYNCVHLRMQSAFKGIQVQVYVINECLSDVTLDMISAVMAVISISGLPQTIVTLFTDDVNSNDPLLLERCASFLDWTKPLQFEGFENAVYTFFLNRALEKGSVIAHDQIESYYYPVSDPNNNDGPDAHSTPDFQETGIVYNELEIRDARIVNDRWPAKCPGSLNMLEVSILNVGSAAVFVGEPDVERSNNNELLTREDQDKVTEKLTPVSWAVALPFGSIHALYTEEEHQGKGYAKKVMQGISKQVTLKGRVPVVQIYKTNDKSKGLNQRIGFVYSHDINLLHYFP